MKKTSHGSFTSVFVDSIDYPYTNMQKYDYLEQLEILFIASIIGVATRVNLTCKHCDRCSVGNDH